MSQARTLRVAPAGRKHNLQTFKANALEQVSRGSKCSTPPVPSAHEPDETPCHGLLRRGSRVTTRRSVAAGENQSGVYSIKPRQMFNQSRKNRAARGILSNLGGLERPVGVA